MNRELVSSIAVCLLESEKTLVASLRPHIESLIQDMAASLDAIGWLGDAKAALTKSFKEHAVPKRTALNYRTSIINGCAQVHLGLSNVSSVVCAPLNSSGFTGSEAYAAASQWLIDKGINQGGKGKTPTPPSDVIKMSVADKDKLVAERDSAISELDDERTERQALGIANAQLKVESDRALAASKEASKARADAEKSAQDARNALEGLKNEIKLLARLVPRARTKADQDKILQGLIKLAEKDYVA